MLGIEVVSIERYGSEGRNVVKVSEYLGSNAQRVKSGDHTDDIYNYVRDESKRDGVDFEGGIDEGTVALKGGEYYRVPYENLPISENDESGFWSSEIIDIEEDDGRNGESRDSSEATELQEEVRGCEEFEGEVKNERTC